MLTPNDQNIKRTRVDYIFAGAVVLLAVFGTVAVMSAVTGTPLGNSVTRTHLIALPAGAAAFLFGWLFNYQVYKEQWKWLYGFIVLVLLLVLIPGIGSYQRGSRSWFVLPFFSVQPVEACRVALILVISAWLSNARRIKEASAIILPFAIAAPVFFLIMRQPDFSAIVITMPVLLALLFCAGVNLFYLILIFLFGLFMCAFPIGWTYIYLHPALLEKSVFLRIFYGLSSNPLYMAGFVLTLAAFVFLAGAALKQFRIYVPAVILCIAGGVMTAGFGGAVLIDKHIKHYQRKRIEAFIAPSADPKGAGYNVLQAQIAMGAGGVLGKGVFSGTQSRLGFVPEKHTDFILAVVGEELGLWGTLAVLALYFIMLWRIVVIAYASSDTYGYLVCAGVFSMFFIYACVNFGMLIGLAPVAGVPLPLISYGGSNFVASMWALGIVQSVYSGRITFR